MKFELKYKIIKKSIFLDFGIIKIFKSFKQQLRFL